MIRSIAIVFAALFLIAGIAHADSYTVKNNHDQKILVRSTAVNFSTGQGNERENFFEPTGTQSRKVDHGKGFLLVTIFAYQHDNHGVSCMANGTTQPGVDTKWRLEVEKGASPLTMKCTLTKP